MLRKTRVPRDDRGERTMEIDSSESRVELFLQRAGDRKPTIDGKVLYEQSENQSYNRTPRVHVV